MHGTTFALQDADPGHFPAVADAMPASLYYPQPTRVIIPSSALTFAALLPFLAAGVAAAASSQEIEMYVLVGAMLAVFLAVAWVRTKTPSAGIWSLTFTVIATFALGWIAPEPIVWWISPHGDADLPRKLWAFLGLCCGLAGATFVVTVLNLIQKYLPSAVESVVTTHIPGGGRVEVMLPSPKNADPKP